MMTKMFNPQDYDKHVGSDKPLNKRLYCLKEVEKYFIKQCNRRNLEFDYDVTAYEPFDFKTVNYTTYAGLFIMHPLQPELSYQQVYQAHIDKPKIKNFSEFVLKNYYNRNANKYDYEREVFDEDFDALVVLPGENKLKDNICVAKLKWILKQHNNRVIFKPHPLTKEETLNELKQVIGANESHFAPLHCDLYLLLDKAKTIYTTHISESALYSTLLNKEISPIDAIQKRVPAAFAHINHYLFVNPDAKDWINHVFSSHKSGVLHPEIDDDWKGKMDKYFDYILNVRDRQKNFYIDC